MHAHQYYTLVLREFAKYVIIFLLVLCGTGQVSAAQERDSLETADTTEHFMPIVDTIALNIDAKTRKLTDKLLKDSTSYKPSKYQNWKPDPIRAMWLGLVIPGGGQIYNRKYWKLPIFYGGILGCVYALNWNGQMLRDYSQAYQDITDDDPTTKSYEEMLPINYRIEGREQQLIGIFKRKKDFYRKYRDLSIFSFVAVYALSVIDAYVDAELSTFDIGRDLSLHWSPACITTQQGGCLTPTNVSPGVSLQLTY